MKNGLIAAIFLGASLVPSAIVLAEPIRLAQEAAPDKAEQLKQLIVKRDELLKKVDELTAEVNKTGDIRAATAMGQTHGEMLQVSEQIRELEAEIAAQ
jgi:uncharacterized coiled-coil DUF342 family protein